MKAISTRINPGSVLEIAPGSHLENFLKMLSESGMVHDTDSFKGDYYIDAYSKGACIVTIRDFCGSENGFFFCFKSNGNLRNFSATNDDGAKD